MTRLFETDERGFLVVDRGMRSANEAQLRELVDAINAKPPEEKATYISINLTDTPVTDPWLASLQPGFTGVTALFLEGTAVTDDGIPSIVTLFPKLRMLSFRSAKGISGARLVDMIDSLAELRTLNLRNTRVDSNLAEQCRQKRAGLYVQT